MNCEELMRSRYDAFVRRDWNYLAQTSIHQSIEELSSLGHIEWIKLDVIDAYDNIVEFKAYYKENEHTEVLHEKSSFIKVDGNWKYEDGELYNTKIQRKENCPCGSGKKFNKCCNRHPRA